MHPSTSCNNNAPAFEEVDPPQSDRGPPNLNLWYGHGKDREVEAHRNLEVIWLLRRLRPDFKTIADFRRDNRDAFRQVFREFVRMCRELDLFAGELIAVDGTRIKAVNSRDRNFTRAAIQRDLKRIDERLEHYLRQMNEADAADVGGDWS